MSKVHQWLQWVLLINGIILFATCEGNKVENPCSPKFVIPSGEEVCECNLNNSYPINNSCITKTELTYKMENDLSICFSRAISPGNNIPRVWRFVPEVNKFVIYGGYTSYSPPSSIGEQSEYSLEYLSDGRLEFKADVPITLCSDCPDLCRQTDDPYLHVDLYGISNIGNTKMDIRAIYYSLPGRQVIDTAWIHLYK